MENNITINSKSSKFMLFKSVILFILVSFLSFLNQYLYFGFVYIDLNLFIVLSPLILAISHELLHYLAYIIFPKLKAKDLYLKRVKGLSLPFISTYIPISKNNLIAILLFPTIILSIVSFALLFYRPNLLYSIVLSGAIGIGYCDILLAKEILSSNGTKLFVSLDSEFGYATIHCKSK